MQRKTKRNLVFFPRFVFGFGVFGSMCLFAPLLLPILWLFTLGNQEVYRRSIRTICRYSFRSIVVYLRLIGFIDVKFENHPKKILPGIYLCNHISMFDIVTILAFVPDCRTFVKAKFLRNPFISPFIRACGFIPIGDDPSERIQATIEAMKWLENGGSFVVFPEGTRTRSGALGKFHDGAFRMALGSKAAVRPIILTSSEPVFNNINALSPTGGTIQFRATLMPEIPATDGSSGRSEVIALRDSVREKFLGWLSQPDVYSWHRAVL